LNFEVPDRVRQTVMADGNESWLDELPGVVDSIGFQPFGDLLLAEADRLTA
jgi:hypothetical protein